MLGAFLLANGHDFFRLVRGRLTAGREIDRVVIMSVPKNELRIYLEEVLSGDASPSVWGLPVYGSLTETLSS